MRRRARGVAAAVLALALAGACGEPPPPADLPGTYGADIPALGTYSRRVQLVLDNGGDATLSLSTALGQLHSIRDGRWEFKHGILRVTLYTKSLLGTAGAGKTRQPDEVLTFRDQSGSLQGRDYDRQRWNYADLSLDRELTATAAANP
jgi:hypothetical protein